MTAFLLPCDCSADVVVTAGQAGGSVHCPRCGRTLAVPKLRDLGGLERDDHTESPQKSAWRPAHAVVLLGAILAAVSWLGGLWFASGPTRLVDDAVLRSAVLSVDDLAIYKVWTEGLARAGVRRPPADEEQALLRRARFADGMRNVLHVVAAAAALAAAGAAAVLWSARRPSSGRDAAADPERPRP